MALHEFIHSLELGIGKRLIMLATLLAVSVFIGFLYYFLEFTGFEDINSMDNAQLGRSMAEGRGFSTSYIRPNNLAQLRAHYTDNLGRPANEVDLARFPEINRTPLYPLALSMVYRMPFVDFDQDPGEILKGGYKPEFFTVIFNQLLVTFTSLLVLALGVRMFDWRVGWLAAVCFLSTNLLWLFSLTALPVNLVIMLMAALMLCLHEAIWADEVDRSLLTWVLLPLSAVLLTMIIYAQFVLVWLLIPYSLFLLVAFRYRLVPAVVAIVLAVMMVVPWMYYLHTTSGALWGGNLQLVASESAELGATDVEKDFRVSSGAQFKPVVLKEIRGFTYALESFYKSGGASLTIILFVVCFIHGFKRRRVQLLRMLVLGMILFTVLGTSLINPEPEALSELNPFIPYLSIMVAMGAAVFFILLDRTGINLRLVRGLIIGIFLAINAAPLVLTLLPPHARGLAQYPPYHPPMLRYMQNAVFPEEVMVSDMPWATAWYSNRLSVLMPKNLEQFNAIHTGHHPIKAMLLTPITWQESLIDIDKGKLENWAVLIKREGIPENFPLMYPVALPPNEDEYLFFSDENRWQSR